MGTRGVFGFYLDGQEKVAYNHWDSYPDGLGVQIHNSIAIMNAVGRDKVLANVRAIELVNEDKPPTDAQVARVAEWADTDHLGTVYGDLLGNGAESWKAGNRQRGWYEVLHAAQGNLGVYMAGLPFMLDAGTFLEDSLFCEWGYVANFDTNKLEVWRGFQHSPQENRHKITEPSDNIGSGYYNCRILIEFDLNDMPDLITFLQECYRADMNLQKERGELDNESKVWYTERIAAIAKEFAKERSA